MSILLTILMILLKVLLCILGVALALLLLILLYPIRYQAVWKIDDPEGSDHFDAKELAGRLSAAVKVRWLFGLVRGDFAYPGEEGFVLRIAWIKKSFGGADEDTDAGDDSETERSETASIEKDFADKTSSEKSSDQEAKERTADQVHTADGKTKKHRILAKSKSKEEKDETGSGKEQKTASETEEAVKDDEQELTDRIAAKLSDLYDKFARTYKKVARWMKLLEQESTQDALHRTITLLQEVLRSILPRRWSANGTVGLGDPEKSARLLEGYSVLYPVVAGHMTIIPNYMDYQLDLAGDADGHICLMALVIAFIRFWFNRDVRLVRKRIKVIIKKNKADERGESSHGSK